MTGSGSFHEGWADDPFDIDHTVAHASRVYDYLLGGVDNFESDREASEQLGMALGGIENPRRDVRANRNFLIRAVHYLVKEAGIRQFLDIGTGLPTANNTHEVAQSVAPESRIVYVDHDPLVLAHARALLVSHPRGVTSYIDADLREPDKILTQAADTLDFTQPVALMLMGILGHLTEDKEAYAIVSRLVDGLAPGSHLVLYDDTNVIHGRAMDEMVRQWNESGENPRVNRTPQKLERFFAGLELLDPGVVSVTRWRPGPVEVGEIREVDDFCGVAVKRAT